MSGTRYEGKSRQNLQEERSGKGGGGGQEWQTGSGVGQTDTTGPAGERAAGRAEGG